MINLLDTVGPAVARASWQAAVLAMVVTAGVGGYSASASRHGGDICSGVSSYSGSFSWRRQPVHGAHSISSVRARRPSRGELRCTRLTRRPHRMDERPPRLLRRPPASSRLVIRPHELASRKRHRPPWRQPHRERRHLIPRTSPWNQFQPARPSAARSDGRADAVVGLPVRIALVCASNRWRRLHSASAPFGVPPCDRCRHSGDA